MRRETVAHSKELPFSFGNFCNRLKHFRSYGLIMGVNQSARSKHHIKDDEEVNFDHFQILRAIGKGSFGKVCIVQKKDTGQMYAMKYMSKSACLERDALRNVLREIEILTQLEHPFLVNLWFSFHDEEDMFLVQDLLLGGDLRYHLTQNVQFQIDAVKLYICELAMALDYLQSKRIIHRDIKPDNILLDEEGHAHLTDFNVATVLEENKRYASALSGTKPYMAPEVFACAVDEIPGYDFAVDWWSLGIVAYELCFGCRPHDIHSQTPNKDIRAMLLKEPEWPPTWPPDFVSLVKQLLSPSPSGRIQNLIMLKSMPFMQNCNWSEILDKNTSPLFLPPKGHLNCDPTFELEEMIVESKPLHKKKKRLAKQRSLRELQTPPSTASLIEQESNLDPLAEEFTTFNRQKELDRLERERKEQEWEEELLRAMEASEFPSSSKAVAAKGFRRLPSDLSLPTTVEEPDPTDFGSCEGAVGGSVGNVACGGSVGDGGSVGNKGSASRLPDLLDPCTVKKSHTPCPSMAENKKVAWAKNRSVTVPEGAKLWSKFRKP